MSLVGQSRQFDDVRVTFRFAPDSGGIADVATLRVCANTGSRETEKPETRPSTGLAQLASIFTKQGEVDGLGQQPGRTAFYRLPPGFGSP